MPTIGPSRHDPTRTPMPAASALCPPRRFPTDLTDAQWRLLRPATSRRADRRDLVPTVDRLPVAGPARLLPPLPTPTPSLAAWPYSHKFSVWSPAGIEPATPSLPSMRGHLTPPRRTSR